MTWTITSPKSTTIQSALFSLLRRAVTGPLRETPAQRGQQGHNMTAGRTRTDDHAVSDAGLP